MSTPSSTPSNFVGKILSSPVLCVLLLGFILVMMMGLNSDILTTYATDPNRAIKHCMALAVAGLAVYRAYASFVQRRAIPEMALSGLGRELGIGLLIGSGLYTCSVLILMGMGIYRVQGLNPWNFLLPAVAMAISSGVFEELLFRGVLFLSVETWFGSWVALVVSSLVFGLTHLMNPQGTLEGALFIAVEAGILLAATLMFTRRLWMGMGFHFSWNYTQSGIYSGIVSGNDASQGLLKSTVNGPDLWTGGNFGLESSVVALIVCTTTGLVILTMAVRRGNIVPPIWRRTREETA